MKILVRGDSTSLQALKAGTDLFGGGAEAIVDRMTPSQLLLNAAQGMRPDRTAIESHLSFENTSEEIYQQFSSQFLLNTLESEDCDLILMDPHADMLLHQYQHRRNGWRFWGPPPAIRNRRSFQADFLHLGLPTAREAMGAIEQLVHLYRKKSPNAAVLFLSDPPSVDSRPGFARLGAALRLRVPGLWWGGKRIGTISELEPTKDAELNFFQKMLENALADGFPIDRLSERSRGRVVARYDRGKPVTTDEVLRSEFDCEGIGAVPRKVVAIGPFSTCKKGCHDFVHRRFIAKLGEYTFTGPERPGWQPRYIPMVAGIEELALGHEKTSPNGLVFRFFDRARLADSVQRIRRIWDGLDVAGTQDNFLPVQEIPRPACNSHWALDIGLFEPSTAGERLTALSHIVRFGDLVLVTQIMDERGLQNYPALRWLLGELAVRVGNGDELLSGVNAVMYGGMENGNLDALRFKIKLGLKPTRLRWEESPSINKKVSEPKYDANMLGRNKISSYRRFLTLHMERGLKPIKYYDYSQDQSVSDVFLLRHDVDHSLVNALMLAKIENEMGICSTYFMLHPGDYDKTENYYGKIEGGRVVHSSSFIDGCLHLQELGHEVGLHNDFIHLSFLTGRPAEDLIKEEVISLRRHGVLIAGSASHGSDFARENKFVNYELFAECRYKAAKAGRTIAKGQWQHTLNSVAMPAVGLSYESYFVRRNAGVSDTGSTLSLLHERRRILSLDVVTDAEYDAYRVALAEMPRPLNLQVLVHPCWWRKIELDA